MEKTTGTTPSYSMQEQTATERGAGGKQRRQPPRRPPATPYARPQQNQSLRGRLLSKLVDPACRLIAGGATRILPSLFKSFSTDSLPPPEPQAHVQFSGDIEEYDNEEDQNCATFVESKTAGTSGATDVPKAGFDSADNRKGHQGDTNDDGISEIEKLVKGKFFSRDEINRLIEIINSKAAEVPKVNQESKDLILSTGGPEGPIVATNLRRQTEEKQDDLNKAVRDLATPLPKPTLLNETGPSPIEIAKAYMANRTSEVNLGSKSIISKEERRTMLADDFASEPFVPSASPKPSAGWPGSTVLDQRGYLTPQSQRSRFGLHNIPRTPYSRTIYSKSKSKLAHVRDESDSFLNGSVSPLQRSQTSAYGQLRSNIMDNGQGSVGPIRRIRHKGTADTPSRGSIYSHSSLNGSFPVVNSNIPKGLSPTIKRNMEQGGTSRSSIFQPVDKNRSSEMGMPPVHPHSSQTARTILDHLDRTLVTPKEKSEELKIATSWKISQSLDANDAVLTGHNNVPNLGLDYSKSKDKINSRSLWNEKSISVASPESNVKKTTSTSDLKANRTVTMLGSNAGSSIDGGKTRDSQMKTAHKDLPKLTDVPVSEAVASEGLQKPSSNSSGNKPVLASVSVTKPEQRWMFTSDNSTGFTFQVSASSAVSSEPPTPTIIPSILGSSQHQPKEELTGPTYTFGLNRSSPALVFSFPSTSSAPNHIDASGITFNFGSDRSSRISFSSIG
ncbi:Dedicator of cytokinesis protein 6, putative isoform 2 [Hibiscus syriacus]|uniref:Dedicator of cytokinesis protein 6, putative isoform 2 n=1 Tax=Hibiscus syriacus TaxID=106335 RepID=A0A6A3CU60_HIBSY|nr:nuclear pore complex protein NUP1-like [Hibiscus syriacus]KAE8730739.1 Dedicator of cytokinesis protein 6, putative isoform 2 [Hibiscus syriacus]